jgi:putative protease
MAEIEIGVVTHYFGHIKVAAVNLTGGDLQVGDTIHIKGHTTDFQLQVQSMQIEHKQVQKAVKGEGIGLTVPDHAREHDKVFKVVP